MSATKPMRRVVIRGRYGEGDKRLSAKGLAIRSGMYLVAPHAYVCIMLTYQEYIRIHSIFNIRIHKEKRL